MAERDRTDQELEQFFAAARREAPEPGADLMARILADAEREQGAFARVATPSRPRESDFASIFRAVGGWPALAGLAAAACAGLWIGISPPDALSSEIAYALEGTDGYLMSDASLFFDANGDGG